ncbi:hypothetical protein [Mobilicoccus pelagius]|uniref:Uncharacterized protein n=1 Tax=Mobilicoccus pelagius NBRC 104925 TaxID=1089455 RepID=H5USP8_9MICO|nr:hypothetical protein [Mobilicoccus pelagius]GAB48756.1 hypothetical protein MOPEL_080_00350 [Mobilicoccus pelagius NBRC 104925]
MPDSPRRAVLLALLTVVLGLLAVVAAGASDGRVLTPWWILCTVLCLIVPLGAWSAHGARSRLAALGGIALSSALLVGGFATARGSAFLVLVLATFAITPAMMLTPRLRGHRVVGLALFGVPLLLVGAAGPATLGVVDLDLGLDAAGPASALLPVVGPAALLGGAATLVGCVVDLASRLRTSVSPDTVRGIAAVIGGLALVLVAAAGAVASGTVSGTASRVGAAVVVLAIAAAAALTHGLRTLASTREVSDVGGILTVLAVLAVLVGALLTPAGALATTVTLVALLALAAVLGAVAGLCGAAALVRAPRTLSLPRLVRPGAWAGVRAHLVQS